MHNILQTMVTAEVVTVSDELRYSVGPRAVALSLRMLQSLDIRTIARRHLQGLVKEIGDDVYLAMRVGNRVFYADRGLGNQRISLDIRLGEPLYFHSTAQRPASCSPRSTPNWQPPHWLPDCPR